MRCVKVAAVIQWMVRAARPATITAGHNSGYPSPGRLPFGVRSTIPAVAFGLWLGVIALPLGAQSGAPRSEEQLLIEDLCGCVSAVDLGTSTSQLERQVRGCLEAAVLRHPSGARRMLERPGSESSAGYKLGQVLGEALDRTCEAFGAVRDRLRRAHDAQLLKKGST